LCGEFSLVSKEKEREKNDSTHTKDFFGEKMMSNFLFEIAKLRLVLIGSSMLPMYKWVPGKKPTFLYDLQPNLAKSSCG
jgi:hypothetical protein